MVGAEQVRDSLGLDGTGVGIAFIDTGYSHIAQDNDDNAGNGGVFATSVIGVNEQDEHGHGTHVVSAATHNMRGPSLCASIRTSSVWLRAQDIVSVRAFRSIRARALISM